MSLIDKVVYYLNDVLVSLDIAPIQTAAKPKNKNTSIRKTKIDTK